MTVLLSSIIKAALLSTKIIADMEFKMRVVANLK
jgi:hypothetical protein